MTIFEQNIKPPKQAALVFALSLVLMAFGWLLRKSGLISLSPIFPWTIATGLLLLFGIGNSVLSLNASSFTQYWGASMYSFMGLAVMNGLAAWAVSGVPVGEAESYKFIYLVVTFGFLVFLSMVNIMKKIVNFAEREEWNQPRKRR